MKEWFILIRTNGTFDCVCCDPERDSLLDFMYSQIECESIETVHVKNSLMIVDEEGLHKDHPETNWIASAIYRGTIVGNALIGLQGERDGEPDIVGFGDRTDAIIHYANLKNAFCV